MTNGARQNHPGLTDSFGRSHKYLRISLTDKCNLRCAYCMPENGIELLPRDHYMTADEILTISARFVEWGIRKIRLTGGEPLVRKDFLTILRRLSELPAEMALSTNGILLDRYADDLLRYNLRKVNISLDTLRPDRFAKLTRRHGFDQVWRNIELALEKGFRLKLNIVLMKGWNDDEIIDFVGLTKENDLSVRFIEFMPFKDNDWNREKLVSLKEIVQKVSSVFGKDMVRLENHVNDTTKHYKIEGYKGNWGVISTVTSPFCNGCDRIRLTADGKIKNCLFSNDEANLLQDLRAGKPIDESVFKSIGLKKQTRAGMDSDQSFSDTEKNTDNRSMIAIGG